MSTRWRSLRKPVFGEFDEADDRRERGVLDEPDAEAGGGGEEREAESLRADHLPELFPSGETEASAGVPLRRWNGLNRAAPDFAEERSWIRREGQSDGGVDGRQAEAGERQDGENQDDLDQPRRVADDLPIDPAMRRNGARRLCAALAQAIKSFAIVATRVESSVIKAP